MSETKFKKTGFHFQYWNIRDIISIENTFVLVHWIFPMYKLLKTRKKSCLTIYLRRVCSIEILTVTLFISTIYFFGFIATKLSTYKS